MALYVQMLCLLLSLRAICSAPAPVECTGCSPPEVSPATFGRGCCTAVPLTLLGNSALNCNLASQTICGSQIVWSVMQQLWHVSKGVVHAGRVMPQPQQLPWDEAIDRASQIPALVSTPSKDFLRPAAAPHACFTSRRSAGPCPPTTTHSGLQSRAAASWSLRWLQVRWAQSLLLVLSCQALSGTPLRRLARAAAASLCSAGLA